MSVAELEPATTASPSRTHACNRVYFTTYMWAITSTINSCFVVTATIISFTLFSGSPTVDQLVHSDNELAVNNIRYRPVCSTSSRMMKVKWDRQKRFQLASPPTINILTPVTSDG